MEIETFIPSGEVPRSRYAGVAPSRWMDPDSEERYRRDPHPELGPDDILYEFNSLGYRCPEFDQRSEVNLITIGCSWTFGMGLPREATYPELLGKGLGEALGRSVTVWNLGLGGHSNDFISRTLLCAVPVLQPDFVIVMFTAKGRREFIGADGRLLNILPHLEPRRADPVLREIVLHHRALSSSLQDELNFIKNYKLVELSLASRNVPWLFTAMDPSGLDPVAYALDMRRYIGFGLEKLDTARDRMHPGPKSQRHFVTRLLPLLLARLPS